MQMLCCCLWFCLSALPTVRLGACFWLQDQAGLYTMAQLQAQSTGGSWEFYLVASACPACS